MDKNVLSPGKLLDASGSLVQSGYAFYQAKEYDRGDIRASKLRIKEWDYYCFADEEYAVALTVADNSYMSLASASVLDFKRFGYITKSKMGAFPRGKLKLPSMCEKGDTSFVKGGVKIEFSCDADGKRKLCCEYKKYLGKDGFECEIELEKPVGDNITIATPFDKPKQFYYNTKINCLRGKGRFRLGEFTHEFANGMGVLDWGRGVWPYRNVWYWSSLSAEIDGKAFGLNLGYGFGNPSGTENVIFFDGKAHKLNNVTFDIPYTKNEYDFLKPWKVCDDEDRLNLMFYPMIDRKDRMNAVVLSTDQHQVFGKFYGKAVLDDGTTIDVDGKTGFAERVVNKW